MSPRQIDAVVELSIGKLSKPEFFRIYGVAESDVYDEIANQLKTASANRDASSLECAMLLFYKFEVKASSSFRQNLVDAFIALVVQDWHQQHENMIRYLQNAKAPRSIGALMAAIHLKPRLSYLSYDDYGSYYKKCLFALHDIGTPDAIAAILACTESAIPELRKEAQYRLARRAERAPSSPH